MFEESSVVFGGVGQVGSTWDWKISGVFVCDDLEGLYFWEGVWLTRRKRTGFYDREFQHNRVYISSKSAIQFFFFSFNLN